ncbi:MAG TPA: SRPBCC domain-containing protein [Steroidobacteraceae bacterium]|nr:SRPBCC domain-containing protein [Steroidobacteraceae bacterium]
MNEQPVHASMLIRRPPGEVFSAFVNPQTLRKFWLQDASGPLAPGARVEWQFMVPGATAKVVVTRFEAPRALSFDWPDGIHVDMSFELFDGGATLVDVAVSGFEGPDAMAQATDTVEGFSIVLCDLKTLLETGESANLVRDKAALIIAAQAKRGG